MNISLTGRAIELTDPIKEYLQNAIASLSKFNLDIISAQAVCAKRSIGKKQGVSVEFTINLAGKNTVVIKQSDDDMYAAIDIAIERAQKALRRMHDKLSDHHHESMNDAKSDSADVKAAAEALEDEVIPVELESYKPREVADVLDELKTGEKQFEIFLDNDGKTRVLYKRNDGRFGLY
ncbi:ribosome-associated translation inhibitor RaiA [Sulfurimonas sp. HSL-3221]|uniref:ribosome hibernation-promoting factor, HPF/YfiA family n=1 Tax=Sulfurimonadaceae TaxID=2771471 RepID=UPI001E586B49|nr:ribosome-associated translation inhibitor RaiA [Sulfurimonas sp. HSL-3221]UFS62094.1 ribosome-associated translation inhibitor RaiA [Sulfurimonas sp. HSL-3221]